MNNVAKKYPIISISLIIITTLVVQSLFGDSMITDAIVQAEWCEATNAICLLRVYFWSSIIILGSGIIIQFLWNSIHKKEVSNATSENFQGGTAKSVGQTGGATLSIGQVDKIYVGEAPKKRQDRKKTTPKDSVQKKNDVIQPKIQTIGVIEPRKENRGYRAAKIQVTNIGKENIKCVARLLEVTRKFEDKEEALSIEKINPNGKFLEWNSSRSLVSNLRVNIPDTVNVLASLREAYTYGDNMIFTFHGYDDVERIKQGEYKISVEFLYSDGNQLQEFYVFEGTLRFNYKTIEWVKTLPNPAT